MTSSPIVSDSPTASTDSTPYNWEATATLAAPRADAATSEAGTDGDTVQESLSNSSEGASPKGFWQVFFSTFVTIFLAELGDKTQVTTLLMSAESHAPWIVFLGAGSALIATSLIGVLLGQWLAQRLSPRTLDKAAGCLLLAITVWLCWDIAGL